MPVHEVVHFFNKIKVVFDRMRSWPDQAHFTFKDVKKLGEFIEAGFGTTLPIQVMRASFFCACAKRPVVTSISLPVLALFASDGSVGWAHATEFENANWFAVHAVTFLHEEHGPGLVTLNNDGDTDHWQAKYQERCKSDDFVFDPFPSQAAAIQRRRRQVKEWPTAAVFARKPRNGRPAMLGA